MEIERIGDLKDQALSEKEKRNLAILDIIRKRGPVTRSDITRITGINAVSVSNYINGFADKKIVVERKSNVSSGGRKPEQVMLNTDENYVAGISIDGKEMSGVIADISLSSLKRFKAPSADAGAFAEELIKRSGVEKEKIKTIGIASYGAEPSRIAAGARKKTGIDAFAESRAVCAALAEKNMNDAADVETLLYIYSDIGYGVLLKNETFTEGDRYLKAWPAHLGMAEMAKREVSKGVGTAVVDLAKGNTDNITSDAVMKAALAKDEVALDIVKSVGLSLGVRVAYLINLFEPKVVVLGGGIEKAGELILGPVRNTVKRFALNAHSGALAIISSSLGEEAATIGAASLAAREIFLKA